MGKTKAILLSFGVLLQLFVYSQQLIKSNIAKYTQKNGLSSYYVTRITSDPSGFLWVGTQDGLNRFDGKSFVKYTSQSSEVHRLGGSLVSDIFYDSVRNYIWVATSYGDICAIDQQTLSIKTRITKDQSGKDLSQTWIRSIFIKDNILWIGTSGNLIVYDLQKGRYLSPDLTKLRSYSSEFNIAKIFCDPAGHTWLFLDNFGIILIDSKTLAPVKTFDYKELNYFNNQTKLTFWDYTLSDKDIYIATNWGLRSLTLNTYTVNRNALAIHSSLLEKLESLACFWDVHNHTLWTSGPDHFFAFDLHKKTVASYTEGNLQEEDWFKSVYQIKGGDNAPIWIGTQEGLGVFNNKPLPFTSFYQSTDYKTKIKHAYSLLPVSDSFLYCGDATGLYRVNLDHHSFNRFHTSAFNLLLFKDNHDNIITSNNSGVFLIKGKELVPISQKFKELEPLKYDLLNCAKQFNDSLILLSSFVQKGLYVWNTNSKNLKLYHDASDKYKIPGLNVISNLYVTTEKDVLILTDKAIISFNPLTGQYTSNVLKLDNHAFSNFMDICETHESYWIGLYGNGIIELDKHFHIKKVLTSKDGLSNDAVYKVFSFNDSLIIATTNNGISVINCNNHKVKTYYQEDGLNSNSFEQLCGFQMNDRIYAGGVDGFTIINPWFITSNKSPPSLYFTNIKTEARFAPIDTNDISIKKLAIHPYTHQTKISFIGLNYLNPGKVKYSYRISEIDPNWMNLGDQNFITLIGINPGTYHLQVQSFNEDGIASNIKEISLKFLPKWYQTWWFKLLLALFFISSLYALYRIRLAQLKKEQLIRTKLASDLHDDLGSTLNSVKVYTNLAIMDKDKEKYLPRIKHSIQEAIIGVKDMIWILDDKKDTVEDLLLRISQFASPICEAHDVAYTQQMSDDVRNYKLPRDEKRNLYMILKEAINNTCKYSEGKNANVAIELSGKKPRLIIKDDGKGFDTSVSHEGNGLNNMKTRAQQIKYTLTIHSSDYNGTEIRLEKI